MAIVEQPIDIYRGENVLLSFVFDPVEDITGQTFQFTVARKPNAVVKLIGPLPVVVDNPVTSAVHVQLAEELTDLKPGSYYWDAWRTDETHEQVKGAGPFVVHGNARVPPIE